jgi:hypothetical protein
MHFLFVMNEPTCIKSELDLLPGCRMDGDGCYFRFSFFILHSHAGASLPLS